MFYKINQRSQYKVITLTYKTLKSSSPTYLHSLLSLNRTNFRWLFEQINSILFYSNSTRSCSLVTLTRPSNRSSLQITKRSVYRTAPALWNSLSSEIRHVAPATSTSPLAIYLSFCLSQKAQNLSLSLFFSTFVCTWSKLHLDGYHSIYSYYGSKYYLRFISMVDRYLVSTGSRLLRTGADALRSVQLS